MNIISNVCSGAYLYNKMGIQFSNPFMWSVLHHKDLKELCTNYTTINFENIKIVPCERVKGALAILLEDKILIEFVHYFQDSRFTVPTKIGADVHFAEMRKYTLSKYFDRLRRMKQLNEAPVFLLMDMKDDFTKEHTQDIINCTKYKTIIFTNRDYDIKNESVNLIKTSLTDSQQLYYDGKAFIDDYYNDILRLL